jgi:predicted nucleic acid-binding protein
VILPRRPLRSETPNDSWIAATAMSLGIPVVTQDVDCVRVAGLDVLHV